MRKESKVVKRLLAIVLTLAMMFTGIGWGSVSATAKEEGEEQEYQNDSWETVEIDNDTYIIHHKNLSGLYAIEAEVSIGDGEKIIVPKKEDGAYKLLDTIEDLTKNYYLVIYTYSQGDSVDEDTVSIQFIDDEDINDVVTYYNNSITIIQNSTGSTNSGKYIYKFAPVSLYDSGSYEVSSKNSVQNSNNSLIVNVTASQYSGNEEAVNYNGYTFVASGLLEQGLYFVYPDYTGAASDTSGGVSATGIHGYWKSVTVDGTNCVLLLNDFTAYLDTNQFVYAFWYDAVNQTLSPVNDLSSLVVGDSSVIEFASANTDDIALSDESAKTKYVQGLYKYTTKSKGTTTIKKSGCAVTDKYVDFTVKEHTYDTPQTSITIDGTEYIMMKGYTYSAIVAVEAEVDSQGNIIGKKKEQGSECVQLLSDVYLSANETKPYYLYNYVPTLDENDPSKAESAVLEPITSTTKFDEEDYNNCGFTLNPVNDVGENVDTAGLWNVVAGAEDKYATLHFPFDYNNDNPSGITFYISGGSSSQPVVTDEYCLAVKLFEYTDGAAPTDDNKLDFLNYTTSKKQPAVIKVAEAVSDKVSSNTLTANDLRIIAHSSSFKVSYFEKTADGGFVDPRYGTEPGIDVTSKVLSDYTYTGSGDDNAYIKFNPDKEGYYVISYAEYDGIEDGSINSRLGAEVTGGVVSGENTANETVTDRGDVSAGGSTGESTGGSSSGYATGGTETGSSESGGAFSQFKTFPALVYVNDSTTEPVNNSPAYIKIFNSLGETDRSSWPFVIYDKLGDWVGEAGIDGESYRGISFDEERKTVTINNCNQPYLTLQIQGFSDNVTLKVVGENQIANINVIAGGLDIEGEGTLKVIGQEGTEYDGYASLVTLSPEDAEQHLVIGEDVTVEIDANQSATEENSRGGQAEPRYAIGILKIRSASTEPLVYYGLVEPATLDINDSEQGYLVKDSKVKFSPDVAGKQKVATAIAAINALPSKDAITLDKESDVIAARTLYDALSGTQKKLVDETVYAKLTAAEDAIAELKKAAEEAAAKKAAEEAATKKAAEEAAAKKAAEEAEAKKAAEEAAAKKAAEEAAKKAAEVPAAGTETKDDSGATYTVKEPTATDTPGTVQVEYTAADNTDTKVDIPSTVVVNGVEAVVTTVASGAFEGNTTITSVTIPATVEEIKENAFKDCTNLETVDIPKGVEEIGTGAFQGCTSLTTVKIPDTVETIGTSAFQGCTSIKTVTIPKEVKDIGKNAFANCSNITTVTIKSTSITTISQGAFKNCKKLKKVTITKSVTTIAKEAFSGDKKLKTITITSTKIKSVGKNAFKNVPKNSTIKLPKMSAKQKAKYKKMIKKAGFKGKFK